MNMQGRPHGFTIIASLMILFGLAELVTGITHNFFGLVTAQNDLSTDTGAAIGLLYILSGLFKFPLKRWGAALAIFCLAADVAGRLAMVGLGLYPLDSSRQFIAIFLGTIIAVIFAVYIGLRWKSFD